MDKESLYRDIATSLGTTLEALFEPNELLKDLVFIPVDDVMKAAEQVAK